MSERIPVIYKGKALMPMRWKRAKQFLKAGKGKIKYDKDGNLFLKIKGEPSGNNVQEIVLGIDPGSYFDGMSVVSSKVHHCNIELIHNKDISDAMKTRAMYRHNRRSRLRHRKIRFSNRISSKLSPTIRSMAEFRINTIKRLLKIYPITKIVIEDVKYNHYISNKGKSFSQAEQGKNMLYSWVKSIGIVLELYKGYNTKKLRINSFGNDPKLSDKGSRSFYAHCIDSFVLACKKVNMIDYSSGEILEEPVIEFNGYINKVTKFIKKIYMVKRKLHQSKAKVGNAKYYYRYSKGGIKNYFVKFGKIRICRTHPPGESSNHPKKWDYINIDRKECLKSFKCKYGGSIAFGKSRSYVPIGKSKRCKYMDGRNGGILTGYQNRNYIESNIP